MPTYTCNLDLTHLPIDAQHGHIFPNFPTGALISVGLLCDHGYTVHLDDRTITIVRNSTTVFKGYRTPASPLWRINLPPLKFNQPLLIKNYAHVAQVLAQTAYTDIPCNLHDTIGHASYSCMLHWDHRHSPPFTNPLTLAT